MSTASRLIRWIGLPIALLCFQSTILAQECAPGLSTFTDASGNTVVYYGVEYGDSESTWFYCVESGRKPALSHISFEVCSDLLSGGTWGPTKADRVENQVIETKDQEIKFDTGWDDNEVRYIYYSISESALESEVTFDTKSGQNRVSGTTQGPDPECSLCSADIRGNVFHDTNKNGVFEIGEAPLNGVTIGLFDVGGGTPIELDETASGGSYEFGGLSESTYDLDVDEGDLQAMSPPLFPTTPEDGNSTTVQVCSTRDFGYADTNAALGDFVWLDDSNPGIQDPGERGIQDVKLSITAGPSQVGESRLTDYFGWYFFKDLDAGEYTVELDPETALFENVTVAPGAVTTGDVALSKAPPSDLQSTSPLTVTKSVTDGFLNTGFDFGFSNIALPIELASFGADAEEDQIRLFWTTVTESSNSGFAVDHLVDGSFAQIGFVPGAGTSNERRDYEFQVAELIPGAHAFRLRQIDFDGSETLSQTVEVTLTMTESVFLGESFPNPFAQSASITLGVRRTQHVRMTLHDTLGREVRTILTGSVEHDVPTSVVIDGSDLTSGHYMILVQGEDFQVSRSLVLLK